MLSWEPQTKQTYVMTRLFSKRLLGRICSSRFPIPRPTWTRKMILVVGYLRICT